MLLVFVPNAKAITPELVKEHGIDCLLSKSRNHREAVGPTGHGLLISDGPIDRIKYSPEEQVWSARFGCDSMIGHWEDQKPTPTSLVRESALPGRNVELLDGNDWQIPLLRRFTPDLQVENQLPRVVVQSPENGSLVVGAVVPKYRDIWEQSLDVATHIFGQLKKNDCAELEDQIVEKFAFNLLKLNYRIDDSVVSHLQLLSPDLIGAIVCAAIDMDTLKEHLKKKMRRT